MNNVTENGKVHIQELLIRMERNGNTIQRLFKQLSSYTCEPNNYSCFEKLYDLKQNFQAFFKEQKHIVAELKREHVEAKHLNSDVQLHLQKFKQLEMQMAQYLLDMNQYS